MEQDKAKPDEKVMNRIRKLLRLARNEAATDGEADNAMRSARKLLAKHGLAEAEVSTDNTDNIRTEDVRTLKHWPRWLKSLLMSSGELCSVNLIVHMNQPGKKSKITYTGYPTDIAVAIELYKYLEQTAKNRAREELGKGWSPDHHQFCMGFAFEVQLRVESMMLKEETERAETESCTDIMLVKSDAVGRWVGEKYDLKVQHASGRNASGSRESNIAGRVHGSIVDLGTERRMS